MKKIMIFSALFACLLGLAACSSPGNGGPPTTYTVIFDLNGGSGTVPSAQTVNAGSGIILPDGYGLSKSGYAFNGWNTKASGTGTNYNAGASYTVTETITLYARWDVATYTITFNANGGSGTVPTERQVPAGYSTANLPDNGNLSLVYAAFTGWNTSIDGTGTAYTAGSSFTPSGNIAAIILYAQWTITTPFNSVTGVANKLKWLAAHAQNDTSTSYTIEANADENIGSQTLSYGDRSGITITLKGDGTNCAITGFTTVDSGVTLVLDNNITLGQVTVNSGGTLKMNAGSAGGRVNVNGGTFTMNGGTISGNTVFTAGYYGTTFGGGVNVSGGTFTMSGGEISNNSVSANHGGYGGGVSVSGGTFTMSGGTISNNTASAGGGVMVGTDGTFIMSGGTISGNTATQSAEKSGGGVYVSYGARTFTMSGGTISGNTATQSGGGVGMYKSSGTFTMTGGTISGNTASYGGGVSGGRIDKTGGTIYGYSASDTVNSNAVKDSYGNIKSDSGHAVYVDRTPALRRETTAGPGVNLSYNGTIFSGDWEF